ncbi:ketopantoate reductase family protein [Streptomyces sp. NPDC057743]|uniref:ketopantoate reductase family protein n=1 Tax=Streptomyces sp. NPDC057743 TaxID=3346236 RepID=UPI00367BE985
MNATTAPRTVAVLGPGGVGGLAAALLARAGHRVICLAGDETVQVLRSQGVHVTSGAFGDFSAPVEADTQLRDPVDLCLVGVKQTALASALERVPEQLLGDRGVLVPLLNGLEHLVPLRARYGDDRVVAATISVVSARTAPGRIEHHSPFARIDLAAEAVSRARLDDVAAVLGGAGFATRVRTDENAMMWEKLAFLAPMALLTTRYGVPLGEVCSAYPDQLRATVGEVATVAGATGAPIDAEAVVGFLTGAPPASRSSMQRDAEAGRALELDAIGGAVLRAARAAGVAVPQLTRLVDEIHATAGRP